MCSWTTITKLGKKKPDVRFKQKNGQYDWSEAQFSLSKQTIYMEN